MQRLHQHLKRHYPLVMASLILSPNALLAATVGAGDNVNFSPTVVSNFCDVSSTGGTLAVEKKRGVITSDASQSGNFNGPQAPATIAVASNLTATGTVVVDPPVLTGGTAATSSEVKLGSGSYNSTAQSLNLGSDGSLANTNVHVRFSTTSNGNRFANGTYGAVATVTCTDNGAR